MKIGQLSPKHKIHIVRSVSMTNAAFESKCGLSFLPNTVRDFDKSSLLANSKLFCDRCYKAWLGK